MGILSSIIAIRDILAMVQGFDQQFISYVSLYNKAKDEQWFKDLPDTFQRIQDAKTHEDKIAAVSKLAAGIGKL